MNQARWKLLHEVFQFLYWRYRLTIRNWIHSLPKWSICSYYNKTFSLRYSILCNIFTYFATINSREIFENRNWIEFSILLTFKFGKPHEPNFFLCFFTFDDNTLRLGIFSIINSHKLLSQMTNKLHTSRINFICDDFFEI